MRSELRREVQPVVPYRVVWPEVYGKEAEIIKSVLRDELLYIEHVGSTAVVGFGGRPIVDILAIVGDPKRMHFYSGGLKEAGYEEIVPASVPHGRSFAKDICGDDMRWRRYAHLHIFAEDHPRMRAMIDNRDYLLANPNEARRYEDFNARMIHRYGNDYATYGEKKEEYFQELSERSAEWRRA